MGKTRSYKVTEPDASKRLDVFLAEKLSADSITRSGVKKLVEDGSAVVDGKAVKAGHPLRPGQTVTVSLPAPAALKAAPEAIPLDIIYEDEDIIVIDKPAGLAVHPGAGRPGGTLVNALLHHAKGLSSFGGGLRPGIVHRLDMDTTGVLVAAKNDRSHIALARQFKEHSAGRRYLALVWGDVRTAEGVIDKPLGRDAAHRKKFSTRARRSRSAVTRYRVLERYAHLTLLELTPETGRTHQLRAHLYSINHPIAGDQLYGRAGEHPGVGKRAADVLKGIKRQLLHAGYLSIVHPTTGKKMEFTSPMPEDMERAVMALKKSD